MKLFTSNCVGQDFWHGASAHFRHLAASRRAARSDNVVCLISEKSLRNGEQDDDTLDLSMLRFQCFLFTLVTVDGTTEHFV